MKGNLMLFAAASLMAAAHGSVVLENESMSIGFSSASSGFAVTSIVNRIEGDVRFVDTDRRAPDFWEVRLAAEGGANPKKIVRLQNHTPAKKRSVERIKDGYAFLWKGLSLPDEKECVDVRAEVRLAKGGTFSEWTISVDNRSRKWALMETRCPVLRGVVKSAEADVLMPHKGFGARLHKAYDTQKGEVGEFGYPGWYPMVAAYMKDGAGLYLAAHDPDASNKSLIFARGAEIAFATPVENAGVVGKAAKGPRYPVKVAAFRGDWWKAAHLYREWAVKQKWCAKGKLAVRTDYPKRMSEVDLFLRPNGNPKSVSNNLAHARAALPGLNLGAHWYSWNVQPFDTYYPEFTPKDTIPETFAWMNSIGIFAMPYTNGRIWDQELASAPQAAPHACTGPNGKPYSETYERVFYVMCPTAQKWHDTLLKNFENTVFAWNAGAVYCDQIACSRPRLCYNPEHGHPLAGGNWWAEGYRSALEPVRKLLARKGAPITSEGLAECWLDCIDGHLMCTDPMKDDVPFYPAVYSGYTTYFGARMQHFDRPEVVHAYQVRSLIWGAVPGWMHPWMFRGKNKNAMVVDSLLKTGRVRRAARDFLAYGTLEDELRPLNALKTVEFSWERKAKGKKAKQPVNMFTSTMPAVVGTVWKNHDGTRDAVIAANVSSEKQVVRFALPSQGGKMAPLDIEGSDPVRYSVSGGIAELNLEPRQIVVLATQQ